MGCQTTSDTSATSGSSSVAQYNSFDTIYIHVGATPTGPPYAPEKPIPALFIQGAFTQTVSLIDSYDESKIPGELHLIRFGYHPFGYSQAEVRAIYSTSLPDRNAEILVIRQSYPTPILTIKRRYGEKGGHCTPWEVVADLQLIQHLTVIAEQQGEVLEHSSLEWCDTESSSASL